MKNPRDSPNGARTLGIGISTHVLGLTLLALAPVIAILWLAAAAERAQAAQEAREHLARDARTLATGYAGSVADVGSLLSAFALVPAFSTMTPGACDLLDGVVGLDRAYVSLALVRPDGSFACQTLGGSGTTTSVADREWFRVPMHEGRPATQVVGTGRISRVPVLVVAHPVTAEGVVVGVLGAGLPLDEAGTLLGEVGLETDHVLRLIGRDGILASSEEEPTPADSTEVGFLASGDTARVADASRAEERYIVALAAVPGVDGLVVALRTSETALLAPAQRRFELQLSALAVLGVLVVLLSHVLSHRWVAKPLVGLVRATQEIGGGDLAARARARDGPKEVRALAEAFNQMAASLEDRERTLSAAHLALHESSERLAQAQKMEALGHLTGGVAHDFNNLLTVIGGNLQLALEAGLSDPEGLVRQALRASENGGEVTRRLLAFARKQPLTASTTDLNALCLGIRDLVTRSVGDAIEVRYALSRQPVPCTLDGSQMESVLLNLAVNARDAMPEGGLLTIGTSVREIRGHATLPDGPYGVVEVADTGIGMTRDVAMRAVEPFFTTKDRGQGTGLGLSGALGFAEQSGGTLEIDTEPGRGTRVRVLVRRD